MKAKHYFIFGIIFLLCIFVVSAKSYLMSGIVIDLSKGNVILQNGKITGPGININLTPLVSATNRTNSSHPNNTLVKASCSNIVDSKGNPYFEEKACVNGDLVIKTPYILTLR